MKRRILQTLPPILGALIFFLPATGLRAEVYEYYDPYLPHFSLSLRGGGTVLIDEEADDLYGSLGMLGTDVKFHFFDLPLAVQTSLDISAGEGDAEDIGLAGDDAEIYMFNWRLSLLLEPPPGAWGDPVSGFYVQPYVGGGVGVQYVEEEIDSNFFGSRDAETTGLSYHAVAGIDFVFNYHLSVGLEVLYSDATFNTPETHLDLAAFTISATLKVHF